MKTLKMFRPDFLLCFCILHSAFCLHAQNTTFTYQGRVQDNGTNYTVAGQFKFALVVTTNTSSPATASINYSGLLGSLSVNSCPIFYGGSGYVTAPAVSFSGGSPNATGYATIIGGSVTAITVTSGGNYTGFTAPQAIVTIAPPPDNFANLAVWSNDGTLGLGVTPAGVLNIPVTNGLFTMNLGDPTVPAMATLPAAVFLQPGLQLKIWFNDGVGGFNAFPAQPLTPAPYATYATYAATAGVASGITGLTVQTNTAGAPNLIGGSPVNFVGSGVVGATISGGGGFNTGGLSYTNSVTGDFGTVSGGGDNSADTDSTVGGGYGNTTTGGGGSAIAGGALNFINGDDDAIGGGEGNAIETNTFCSVIAGGYYNTIATNSPNSAIGGGSGNSIGTNSYESVIAGGDLNIIQNNSANTTIGGGYDNIASGQATTLSGGLENQATRAYATVPGGYENVAGGTYSFAAGQQAQALHTGAFVWADSQNAVFASTANDSFNIRAQGGMFLDDSTPAINFGHTTRQMLNFYGAGYGLGVQNFTEYFRSLSGYAWFNGGSHTNTQNNPGTGGTATMTLDGSGNLECAGTVYSKGLALTSDRNAKENFSPVDNQAVLAKVAALPVTQWNYKTDKAGVQHIGPMAQDFQAAFGLDGPDDKHISVVDEGGVALAAIQGLNQKLQAQMSEKDFRIQEQESRIQNQATEISELQAKAAQVDALQKQLNELAAAVKSLAGKN